MDCIKLHKKLLDIVHYDSDEILFTIICTSSRYHMVQSFNNENFVLYSKA